MDDVKKALHTWNVRIQAVILFILYLVCTISFILVLFNLMKLITNLDVQYLQEVLKNGTVTVVSFIAFCSCFLTSSVFEDLMQEIELEEDM